MHSPVSPCELSDDGDPVPYMFGYISESSNSESELENQHSPEPPITTDVKRETHSIPLPLLDTNRHLPKRNEAPSDFSITDWLIHQLGEIPKQKELLILRKDLLSDILPPITRLQKRHKSMNLEVLENHKDAIITRLNNQSIFNEFIQVLLRNRTGTQKNQILMHIFGVDKL